MGHVEQPVQVGVHRLLTPSELHEDGFLSPVALLALQPGDATTYSLGAALRSPFGHLGVQGGELRVIKPDGDLRGHFTSLP